MFQHGDIKIEGTSISGVATSLMVSLPGFKFLMDIGTNLPDAAKCQYVFITHAHIDHMGAAPQHAATRDMMAMPPTKFICSGEVAQGLEKVLRAWQEVQGGFEYKILVLNPGDRMVLCQNLQVQPFSTFHRVPSQGYAFIRETSKLKPEYVGMSGPEIGKLVRSGVEVKTKVEFVEAVFTGDTTSYIYQDPIIGKAKVVVVLKKSRRQ
jgi:ribonuclease Z